MSTIGRRVKTAHGPGTLVAIQPHGGDGTRDWRSVGSPASGDDVRSVTVRLDHPDGRGRTVYLWEDDIELMDPS